MVVDVILMICDKWRYNNPDGNEQEPYTFDQVSRDKHLERCLSIPTLFLALIIFTQRCFSKDKPDSRIRPKCFCSFTFTTTDPLNINRG